MVFASSINCTLSSYVAAVDRDRLPFLETHGDRLRLHGDIVAPERHAHDGRHDLHALVEELEVLGLVRGAEDVGVGRVGLLDAHAVGESRLQHVLGHLLAAAELVDELLIEPGLVDLEIGVGQQAVSIEPLDIVPLERAPVAPHVDVVFLHGDDEHRAGDGPADWRGVEVRDAGSGDVEGAGLQRGQPFGHELLPAVDQARLLAAVLKGAARDVVVVGFVRLTEVGGIRVGDCALFPHPVERGAGIQPAGERNADFFA